MVGRRVIDFGCASKSRELVSDLNRIRLPPARTNCEFLVRVDYFRVGDNINGGALNFPEADFWPGTISQLRQVPRIMAEC
jgi:hypothetical protein